MHVVDSDGCSMYATGLAAEARTLVRQVKLVSSSSSKSNNVGWISLYNEGEYVWLLERK